MSRGLRIATIVPALAVAGWLLASLPLLFADTLDPIPTVVVAVIVTGVLVAVAVRMPADRLRAAAPGALVAALLTLAIAGGFAALAWTTSSSHVIVRRDPAVYAQTADWLADHGSLPIPATADAFGDVPGLTYGSPGFYQRGDPPELMPQFMSGTALLLTPAGWLDGLRGITRANAVIGALALLAVAGLAARLAGPWAAPLAAVTLALVYPELHQARSAYSEPAAQLLVFGGLSLLVDARRAAGDRRVSTALHAIGGLVLGLVPLVRIDALVDLVPMIAVLVVVALAGRRRDAIAAGGGLAVGIGLSLLDGLLLARPYLGSLREELVAIAAAAGVGAVAVVVALWHHETVRRLAARLSSSRIPEMAAGSDVLLAAAAYFIRPHLETPRFAAGDPVGEAVINLQAQLGLPADGPRTYAEESLHWLTWWLGAPATVLAFIGLALLLRRVLRRGDDAALALAIVLLGTTAVVLARPSITPDHPWADRRFVPVVIPGLVVVASWLVVAVVRRAQSQHRVAAVLAAIAGTAALVVVPAVAAHPLWEHPTERGEIALIQRTCAELPPRAAVIIAGARARDELPQVIRHGCTVPVAVAPVDAAAPVVTAAANAARAAGFTPIVVAETEDEAAAAAGTSARRATTLRTWESDRTLVNRPETRGFLPFEIWLAQPR